MKWNYIMDKQPIDEEEIIQVDRPYEGHYCMGMRKYSQKAPWSDILSFYSQNDLGNPDFWWISAKDFPFPDQPERLNPETSNEEWNEWEKFPPPKYAKGILIKFDSGHVWSELEFYGPRKSRTIGVAKPLAWKFMERPDPNKKSVQC